MSDMTRVASLLEVSSKLQTASNYLKHLTPGKKPSSYEKDILEWTCNLLNQIDWNTKYSKKEFNASIAYQATSTRPVFYYALTKISPKLDEIGIKSAKDFDLPPYLVPHSELEFRYRISSHCSHASGAGGR